MAETYVGRARKASAANIISHNAFLIENFQFSPQIFYSRVWDALTARKIPGIHIEKIQWPEGGILSPHRTYLRVTRERLVFDICGAPFGTGFFVSFWFGQTPVRMGCLLRLLLGVMIYCFLDFLYFFKVGIFRLMWEQFHFFRIDTAVILVIIFTIIFGVLILFDLLTRQYLDAIMLDVPFIGGLYGRWIHRITYYRIDNMVMYQEAVRNAVMQVVEEITSGKGIEPIPELAAKPILKELWLN